MELVSGTSCPFILILDCFGAATGLITNLCNSFAIPIRCAGQVVKDGLADRLPNWKARLLSLTGRTTMVKHVLSVIPVYILIAINVSKLVTKSIDKIRRGFLWKGRKNVTARSCLVSWEIITRPLKLGGLGVSNLQFKSWALQAKWLWLEKTDPSRP
jgi:hypothetical protein